jgi:CheY-like chemotaxis protein
MNVDHELKITPQAPALIAAFIHDGTPVRLMQNPSGDWVIERRGGGGSFSPGDRAACARLMLDLSSEAAAARSLIWINRGRLFRSLSPGPVPRIFNPSLATTSLIVIDEDRAVARRLRLHLRRMGYDASFAPSAYHAACCGESRKFDFVISDVGLTDVRDNELLRRLQREVGLVGIQSNHPLHQDDREFYTKPVTAAELHSAIQRMNQPLASTAARIDNPRNAISN